MKTFISILDERFEALHNRSSLLIKQVPQNKLYWQPREKDGLFPVYSCGEYILRSAGAVEQSFGGITTKLWDDPFEWTLPEALFSNEKVLGYLEEVEQTRKRAFLLFASDNDLKKEIMAPSKLKTIFELLLETMTRAENYQGRAFATFRFFSDEKLPH